MRNDDREEGKEDGGILWLRGAPKEKPATEWLAENRVAYGYVALILGLPESGKTLFEAALAAQVMGGPRLFAGAEREPQCVMWLIQEEDVANDILPRIEAAGGNPDMLIHPYNSDVAASAQARCFPDSEEMVVAEIKKQNVGLLVVDAAVDLMCPGRRFTDYQDVAEFLNSLTKIAKVTGAAVVVSHHTKKGHKGPAIEAGLGSQAWGAKSRLALRAFQDEQCKETYYLSILKRGPGNGGATLEFHAEKKGKIPYIASVRERPETAEELSKKAESTGRRAAIENAKEFLTVYLRDGEKHVKDVEKDGRERARLDLLTLREAAHELGVLFIKHRENGVDLWKWHKAGCECAKCDKKRGSSSTRPPSAQKSKS